MKNPSDLTEAEESDSSSSAPQPFDLFAGLSEDQLPASTIQTNVPPTIVSPAQPKRVAETIPDRSATVYWAIAIIAF